MISKQRKRQNNSTLKEVSVSTCCSAKTKTTQNSLAWSVRSVCYAPMPSIKLSTNGSRKEGSGFFSPSWASISSSVFPLVSGTTKTTNSSDASAIPPNIQNTAACPKAENITGKATATKMLLPKLTMDPTARDIPRNAQRENLANHQPGDGPEAHLAGGHQQQHTHHRHLPPGFRERARGA
mmetsp:Transcript_40033/g.75110  ORF Transcript_40033/g.75110 Transcript_40033/m.75110 type:complete len:181 (+) Transcript_40033:78-620(+)